MVSLPLLTRTSPFALSKISLSRSIQISARNVSIIYMARGVRRKSCCQNGHRYNDAKGERRHPLFGITVLLLYQLYVMYELFYCQMLLRGRGSGGDSGSSIKSRNLTRGV
jgi:hypothetical protein